MAQSDLSARVNELQRRLASVTQRVEAVRATPRTVSTGDAQLLGILELLLNNASHTLAERIWMEKNGIMNVVPKVVQTGPRGGAYYIDANGRQIYLKAYQKRQCAEGGFLRGASGGSCPRTVVSYDTSRTRCEKHLV